jgi:type II restriction enzyme
MPFHFRLLGRDRMALYSFIQSLISAFGTSIYEPVAIAIAKENNFATAQSQFVVGDKIYEDCQRSVQDIINELSISGTPDKISEIALLRKNLSGQFKKLKLPKVDLYTVNSQGEQFLFELKTVKPNKGNFKDFKRILLEWAGVVLSKDSQAKVHTFLVIPYNPYEPEPYQRWTMKGMLDLPNELKVADEFWDFLGGKGTYNDLLDCFEQAGIELRPEIDEYFGKFNQKVR